MKVLGVRWFSGSSCVGLVRVLDEFEGIKYYIGSVSGMDKAVDTEHVAAFGARFPNDAGDLLFGEGDDWK